jgi:solute carrier family 35 protein E3
MLTELALGVVAALQGSMLLLLGPGVDAWVSGRWVFDYTMTMPALGVLLLSCAFSVGVNVSQFMCLGRFSAATFQVSGSRDTTAVLAGRGLHHLSCPHSWAHGHCS